MEGAALGTAVVLRYGISETSNWADHQGVRIKESNRRGSGPNLAECYRPAFGDVHYHLIICNPYGFGAHLYYQDTE